MKRAMVWASMLAVCLLFGSLAPAQAATAEEMELSGLYNAIFVNAEPEPEEEPVDEDGDGVPENVVCCVPALADCISAPRDKCTDPVADGGYGGTAHNDLLACRRACS